MNKIFFILPFLILFQGLKAQNEERDLSQSKFLIIAQSYGDSIKLRWSPTSYAHWQEGNTKGYQLTRYTLNDTPGNVDREGVKREILLKPMEQWRELVQNDEMAFLAGGIVYGGLEDLELGNEKGEYNLSQTYQLRKSNDYRYAYSMMAADNSFPTAEHLGLAFIDTEVKKGLTYIYELNFLKDPVQKQTLIVGTDSDFSLPKPINPTIQSTDSLAVINWNAEILSKRYTSYNVVRSIDNGKTYQKINKAPVVHLKTSKADNQISFVDSLAQNGKEYFYKISGVTPFGDKGPLSEPMIGKIIPKPLNASAQIIDITEYPEGVVNLKWSFELENEGKIKGYQVYMADDYGSEYKLLNSTLISPNERVYADNNPLAKSFYKVIAVDENNHHLQSFAVMSQLLDHIAPLAPTMLIGELDEETGVVTLNWNPNQELDLQGYRVFYSNHPTENFIQATKKSISELTYLHQISMNLGNKSIYYKILATDFRENYSLFSETIEVKKPDHTAPTAPVIMISKVNKENVDIKYGKSESRDIQYQALMRRLKNREEAWKEIFVIPKEGNSNIFKDENLEPGRAYEYKIVVNDFDNNFSESKTVEAKVVDNSAFSQIQNFDVNFDRIRKGVQLNWEYNSKKQVNSFVIYRGEGDAPISTYELLSVVDTDNMNFSFLDNQIEKKKAYTYKILGQNSDGSYSELSVQKNIKL